MPSYLTSPADRVLPAPPEPYWRAQLRLPRHRRDTRGALADLYRRALTRLSKARWRMIIEFDVAADIDAPDEASATLAIEAALCAKTHFITLTRVNTDTRPPWMIVGLTDRPLIYLHYGTDRHATTGDDATPVWRCAGTVIVAFTVDVTEVGWPDHRYAIGYPLRPLADGLPVARNVHTGTALVACRRPTWRIHSMRLPPRVRIAPTAPTAPSD